MLPYGFEEARVTHELCLNHFPAVNKSALARKHQNSTELGTVFNACDCFCICVCVFLCVYSCFTDSREETVLGSIPLPSYVIAPVEPEDHINRKYAFKVTQSWH